MIELLQYAFGIVVIGIMAYGCWISSVMLSERSKLRKYTGEYYDFDIDEKLKEIGKTRQEVLDSE
tara:strand:+ start:188 stop:382 length:195 start_codon:yes stop_codon:yes gene_type:complete